MFYFVDVAQLRTVAENPALTADWSDCLIKGGDQTTCANTIAGAVPSPTLMIAAESVTSSMGLVFFFLFAAQRQFLQDWRDLFSSMYRNRRRKMSMLRPNKRISDDEDTTHAYSPTMPRHPKARDAAPAANAASEAALETHECAFHYPSMDSGVGEEMCESPNRGPTAALTFAPTPRPERPMSPVGRDRTFTQMGFADTALPTSPISLGALQVRNSGRRKQDVYVYF